MPGTHTQCRTRQWHPQVSLWGAAPQIDLEGDIVPLTAYGSHSTIGKLRHGRWQEALSHGDTSVSALLTPSTSPQSKGSQLCLTRDRFGDGGVVTCVLPAE